jgi:protein TonB
MQVERMSVAAAPPQKRLVSIMLVAAIHIVAIYALLVALKPGLFAPIHRDPITYVPTNPAPPPPRPRIDIHPRLIDPSAPPIPHPPQPWLNPDDHNPTISNPPPGGSGTGTPLAQPPLPVSVPARGITATHTIPAYPPIAARLNEQGSVRLMLHIDEQGYVVDAMVIGSSGFQALDAAAVVWVKEHWRYQPATRDGMPVPASTEAIVTFRLTSRRG